MTKKIKIVWVCHFSDEKTRAHIKFSHFYYKWIIKRLLGRSNTQCYDMAVWVSNAIHEFERFDDIELTIVFPHPAVKGTIQDFSINGIHYVCFRSEDDNLISFIKRKICGNREEQYVKNRMIIKNVINNSNPDIIHLIGAENPYYSISALDFDPSIPSVVSLQTLMSDPDFFINYPVSQKEYKYRSSIEKDILKKCNYIATPVEQFKDIVLRKIKPNAVFLNMVLALGEDINTDYEKKEFDFVYFAANISKACDEAIEAFAIAHQHMKKMTLNISGSYDKDFKSILDKRMKELGISDSVTFTGSQPTHNDVLRQIKKSRFALLPLKVDLISGTIREAMACGLPVVTTITPATPLLNSDRESLLLSEKGDYESMANNMLRLVEDEQFAEELRQNAIKTVSERYGNEGFMKNWRKGYYQIIDNFHYGTPFTDNFLIQ